MTDKMNLTDEQIIQALGICMSEHLGCEDGCPLANNGLTYGKCLKSLPKIALDLINRQKTEIEILIRKKETLRDEIAEKDAEIERLKNAYKQCAWERDVLGKSEAYREFADGLKQISKKVTVPYVADTAIQEHKTGMFYYGKEDFDNLVKELTEKKDFKE